MFQDKTIVCKDCGQEFTFTANEQEFFAERASPMSRSAANPAAMPAKVLPTTARAASARCLTLYALPAAVPAKFRSSPVQTVRSTAAIASVNNSQPTRPSGRVFVFCSGRLRPAKTASRRNAGRRFTFFVYSPAPIAGRIAFVLGFLPRHFLRFDDQRAVR